MQYALIAAALVGAVAASPAWAPPAYGGSDDGSWGSASTVDQTTVVTITSCGAEVTNCPADSATTYAVTTPASEVSPPAYTPETETTPASSPYSPVTTSASGWGPPAYGSPSAPASVPASSPYSPEQPSSYESVPPPAATTPATSAPPAETPYSPVGGSAPPAYPSGAPAYPSGAPIYPVPGNGTWGATGTASGAPSASEAYPVQQTGNTAAGLKAGSFLAGAGALAALLL